MGSTRAGQGRPQARGRRVPLREGGVQARRPGKRHVDLGDQAVRSGRAARSSRASSREMNRPPRLTSGVGVVTRPATVYSSAFVVSLTVWAEMRTASPAFHLQLARELRAQHHRCLGVGLSHEPA